MFKQCSTKWIRNSDKSKDEYGDWQITKSPHIHTLLQKSTRIHMEVMVAKKLYHRQVRKTKFVRNFMRKLVSWKMIQIGKKLTITLWKNFWNVVRPSLCSYPLMRSGLTDFLTDLSFKEDHTVSEQQQNLLFLNKRWTIWMVCNLQGRAYLSGSGCIETILILGYYSEGPRRGREAFAPQEAIIGTPKTLTKWPGQMPLR